MNAWYLDIDAYQGALQMIPLGGSAAKGGSLLFGATWSIDTGDGASTTSACSARPKAN